MTALAFAQVMKNPGLLRNHSLSELQELALRYPYASTVYSMVALKAHLDGDGNYEHHLNQAAIRIPDRKRLYSLIHTDYDDALMDLPQLAERQTIVGDELEVVIQEKPVERMEEAMHEPAPFAQEENGVQDAVKEEAPVEQSRVVEEEKYQPESEPDHHQPEPEHDPEAELELHEPEHDPESGLELHQSETDPEAGLEHHQAEPEVEEEPAKPVEIEEPVAAKEIEEEKTIDLPGTDEVLEALNAIRSFKKPESVEGSSGVVEEIRKETMPGKQKPFAPPDKKDAHSFTEWLSMLKGDKEEEPVQKEPVEEEMEEIPIEPPPITIESLQLESLPLETEEEKELDEIITAKQAKASLAQDDELVTETLAKIYESQKKYDKAIKAYRTLSLKFPEKRAYFADKIEKLKKK